VLVVGVFLSLTWLSFFPFLCPFDFCLLSLEHSQSMELASSARTKILAKHVLDQVDSSEKYSVVSNGRLQFLLEKC
jgi:hypothetical protein